MPVPLAACPACALTLPYPRRASDLVAVALVIALSVFVSFYTLLVGIAIGLVGLAAFRWRCQRRYARWQRGLKALLGKVPAYGQLLDQYRFATVVIPDGGAARESEE